MTNRLLLIIVALSFSMISLAQTDERSNTFFVGYETLEMAMNKFQNFAGEFGYRFDNKNQLRLMVGEVNLTERHLSNKFEAVAVDGENVKGYFRIYELNYDRFFGKKKNWYASGSAAYVRDKYEHLISTNQIDNQTATVGFGVGYQKRNLLKIKHLYVNFSIPFRYYFNDIPKMQWGDTKILPHKFVNNIWLFVGYHF